MSRTVPIPRNIQLFQDEVAKQASNGALAPGKLIDQEAKALQHYQHAGRPIFNFWGGSPDINNNTVSYRFERFNFLESGGRHFRGHIAAVPFNGAATTTQGITLSLNGVTQSNTRVPLNLTDGISTGYPENIDAVNLEEVTQDSISGLVDAYSFGPTDAGSPRLASGVFWEDFCDLGDTANTITTENFRAGSDILATKSGSSSTQTQLRQKFKDTWRYRRPTIGWCMADPNNSTIKFATSSANYRYIFDQSIGTGGTAPSATGPGISLPLRYSAAGRRNQVRVYVRIYAYLIPAGGGDGGIPGTTGDIAIANKDSSGTMTAFTALSGTAIAVTSPTASWYPSSTTFNPTTDPHFDAYAGSAFDRILLGARSTGGGAYMAISAFQFLVFHVAT